MANSQDGIFITREILYQKIWEIPAIKLALELGISDVALGKICKKLDIPKPPPGYWSRVQFGYKISIPSLPPAKKDIPSGAYVTPTEKQKCSPVTDKKVLDKVAQVTQPINKIKVSDSLRNPHPLTKQTKEILSNSKPDDYGALIGRWKEDCLDIRVSKSSLKRSLLIMDALIKALEKNGMRFSGSKQRRGETEISNNDSQLYIKLHEGFKRFKRELTAEEKKKSWMYDRYQYEPSNKFVLTLHGFYLGSKAWSDRDTKSLEDQLSKIVADIIEVFEVIRQRKIEEKIQSQRKLEDQQLREEELQRIREEVARREQLELLARDWRKGKDISDYLEAFEEYFFAEKGKIDPDSPEAKWLVWAKAHAERLNPLKNNKTEKLIDDVYSASLV